MLPNLVLDEGRIIRGACPVRKKGKINQEILRQNNLEYSATRDDLIIRPVVGAHYSYAYSISTMD